MKWMMPAAFALTCCLAVTGAAAGVEYFVAPTGADDNPGTMQQPFASLTRARDAIRALKAAGGLPEGGVTVWLRGGTYYLPESFQLGPDDSGTESAPIVYRRWGDEEVWISGGRAIDPSHFKPVTNAAVLGRLDPSARGKVLQLDMAAEGITDYLPELPDKFLGASNTFPVMLEVFCNGERMQLARWPNEGFSHFADIVDTGSGLRDRTGPERPGVFSYEGDRPERWRTEEGVWLLGYWARAYICEVARVGSIDTEKKQIALAVPMHYGLDTWGAKRFFALDVLEELDIPGEWYLDRKRGVLYFWPPAAPDRCAVTISMLKDPMIWMQGASWVTIRGVGLENGRLDAVSINKGDHDTVIGCTIRNVGRHAVQVSGGSDHGVV
ncbi:MAG TPA: right-handed parallel beta-helix repeat-containing protein, partial [Armatimonadota bacterium]|nr:right-handed parallel beta-helix repeat-containing protein [Armatimonadota bacterium]